jgi:hypothetical protein
MNSDDDGTIIQIAKAGSQTENDENSKEALEDLVRY